MSEPQESEFSRLLVVDRMTAERVTEQLSATPDERAALARRFGVIAIDALDVTVQVNRLAGGRMARVRGTLTAAVRQRCVVTLEEFPSTVEESFSALFERESSASRIETELDLDPEVPDEDWPEPMVHGRIDLGELAAQHLSLALDLHPRRPGAVFGEAVFGAAEDETPADQERVLPFQALAGRRGH